MIGLVSKVNLFMKMIKKANYHSYLPLLSSVCTTNFYIYLMRIIYYCYVPYLTSSFYSSCCIYPCEASLLGDF